MIKFILKNLSFKFVHKDDILSGKAQYIKNENSFFYEPWNDVNFSILIRNGYNSLDVNLQTKKALQLTGLNPQMNWIRKNLIVPKAQPGNLFILPDQNYQTGTGIQYATNWQTYFNPDTGWICIGNPNDFCEDSAVLFANNTIAMIENNNINSIWIKPTFV